MYCPNCGQEVNSTYKFCSHCGESLKHINHSHSTEMVNRVQPKNNSEKKGSEEMTDYINGWSWGAFSMSWLYLISMKYSFWWVFILFSGVESVLFKVGGWSWLGYTLTIIIGMYAAIAGRQYAYESRDWKNDDEFKAVQRAWDGWGIFLFFLAIAGYSILIYEHFNQ